MATHLRFGLAGMTFGIALGIGWIIERDDGQGRAAVAVMAAPTALALPQLMPTLSAPPAVVDHDVPAATFRGPLRSAPMPLSAPAAVDEAPEAIVIDASADPRGCAVRLSGKVALGGALPEPACARAAVSSFSGAGLPAAVQDGWAHRAPADMPALALPSAAD